MSDTVANQIDVQVTTIRDVAKADVLRTREVVLRVLAHAPRPVLYAKATLNVLPDPAVARPNLVSLRIGLNGVPVSAHASAASMSEAVTLAATRLRARMEHVARHWETRRTAMAPAPARLRDELRTDAEIVHPRPPMSGAPM
ncbi:hypothetical protein HUT06_25860 [Actinomadura sp. NAK00032]|uniref:hypothetical protein n=1 Tax=Actinomadura sp. NAK00032 TaxID=2742128 RepID=UPI00159124F3|nr:hypothetical protein [Actinomadura sp. NAK00032]QKW37015.1 hypothetical protein HUT06_25860 [Actinomadura sp. NAK00032]